MNYTLINKGNYNLYDMYFIMQCTYHIYIYVYYICNKHKVIKINRGKGNKNNKFRVISFINDIYLIR